MPKIKDIKARFILDSKSNPTIEVKITSNEGKVAIASCPSGTSSGSHEALELRDTDKSAFNGKGVTKAVENINSKIKPELIDKEFSDQANIDQLLLGLDGTTNKKNLGANAILPVSIACIKLAALYENLEAYEYILNKSDKKFYSYPYPLINLINGGLHAGMNLDIQEFMIIPKVSDSISDNIIAAVKINSMLKNKLSAEGFQTLVGDEGGVAPKLESNQKALDYLRESIGSEDFTSNSIRLGMDVAASSFYKDKKYKIKDLPVEVDFKELTQFYLYLNNKYNFEYLEDPFFEDDLDGFEYLMQKTDSNLLVTGDDLTVTNKNRLKMAIDKKLIRCLIIKPNQIGTVSETLEVIKFAKQNNIKIAVSHRSGETNDDFIADFAIGVQADYVKFGAPVRGERIAKYNRLMQIESELSKK